MLCCSISRRSLVRFIRRTISKNRNATHIPVRVSNILLFLLLSPGTRFPEETGRFATSAVSPGGHKTGATLGWWNTALKKAGVGGSTPSLATILISFVYNQRNRLCSFVLFLICRHC